MRERCAILKQNRKINKEYFKRERERERKRDQQ